MRLICIKARACEAGEAVSHKTGWPRMNATAYQSSEDDDFTDPQSCAIAQLVEATDDYELLSPESAAGLCL